MSPFRAIFASVIKLGRAQHPLCSGNESRLGGGTEPVECPCVDPGGIRSHTNMGRASTSQSAGHMGPVAVDVDIIGCHDSGIYSPHGVVMVNFIGVGLKATVVGTKSLMGPPSGS